MVHLLKLSVGVRDVAHLRAIQALRATSAPPLRHQTRMAPKRRQELLDGGSIYWVIGGYIQVRQRLLDIIEDKWDDGTACAGLVLHPELVPVAARPMKPFQGWRYLDAEAAPEDITEASIASDELPPALKAALREAFLI